MQTDTDESPADEAGPDDAETALDGAALVAAVLLLAVGADDPQADGSNTPVSPAASIDLTSGTVRNGR